MSPPHFDNVLIFGATGEVGSAAALEASSRGAKVWIALRDVTKQNEWISEDEEKAANLQRIQADLTDPASVTKAVKETGAKAVFIYAVHARDLMKSALTTFKEVGIEYVVFLSTCSVKNAGSVKDDIRTIARDHFIPWQHAQIEISLEELEIPHVALRAGFFASNPLRIYLDKKSTPKQVNLLAPEVLHDPIDPKDIGRTAGSLLVNPRQTSGKDIVYLNGPSLLSQTQQWEIINSLLVSVGQPAVQVNHITEEQYLKNLAALHVPDFVSKSLAKSMVETRALYAAEDYEKAKHNVKNLTGREPTSFEDFVKREIPRYFK